jgi:hypothetical protein
MFCANVQIHADAMVEAAEMAAAAEMADSVVAAVSEEDLGSNCTHRKKTSDAPQPRFSSELGGRNKLSPSPQRAAIFWGGFVFNIVDMTVGSTAWRNRVDACER